MYTQLTPNITIAYVTPIALQASQHCTSDWPFGSEWLPLLQSIGTVCNVNTRNLSDLKVETPINLMQLVRIGPTIYQRMDP